MIASFFKNSNSKTFTPNRGTIFGLSQNLRNTNKKPLSQYSNNGYIDLGWVSGLIERLDKFSKISTVAYQILALSLLTVGLVLAFQNFNTVKTSENIVVLNRVEIAKADEKRVWTDTASIDKNHTKYSFKIVAAAVTPTVSLNGDCANTTIKSTTQFSSDQIDQCGTDGDLGTSLSGAKNSTKNNQTKTPTKTIKVEAGENLSYLAMTHKVRVSQIVELNNLSSNKLKLGQVLLVPIGK